MEKENFSDQTDLNETVIAIDKKILTSSTLSDGSQSMVDSNEKDTSIAEMLEETKSFFIVEESGVVHLKTKRVAKTEHSTSMVLADGKADGKTTSDGKISGDVIDVLQDCKKEDVPVQNNETSIADTYLQLDVTDNLDAYLKRERVRKLNLSKARDLDDNQSVSKKGDAADKECPVENQDDTPSAKKRQKTDNPKKNESPKLEENKILADETDDASKSTDVELKNVESSKINETSSSNKSEQVTSEKKDNRFIWVSNVSKGTKATDLKMHFAAHGKVQLAKVVTDGKDCFGYVVMESHEDVVNCMKNLQNSLFESKELVLSDKVPERKQEKSKDPAKDKENRKLDRKKKDSQSGGSSIKEVKSSKSDHRLHSDPLTLKVSDPKERGYSEERRRIETLERKRLLRERESLERKEAERRRREMERERDRERERERERELRRRERVEAERQRQVQLKLEKERRKLEYEKKMIEKQKLELLRYKRKLLGKEKENARDESKKRRNQPEDFDRKKYTRVEEHGPKHSTMDMAENYWKSDKVKSPPAHDLYNKKNTQEMCVPPPPPVLSSNYHSTTEHARSTERDRQWYERKEYEHRVKSYVRKPEDNRNYGMGNDGRHHPYAEKSFPKDQYKHKEYQVVQSHNTWDGYHPQSGYKEQNIPILRNEQAPRAMPRHPSYQEGPYGQPPQDYYPASNYRRVNDYYNRPVERKY